MILSGAGAARTAGESPPLVNAIVFHYELALIHPFTDGNGRVGRLWQHALLTRVSSVFEYVPTESLIRAQQQDYYDSLAASARLGRCDPFLDYMLEVLHRALLRLGGQLRGRTATYETRRAGAKAALGRRWFGRKEYLALFPRLSTASASRDLARAVAEGALVARGARALTRYRFR